MFNRPIRHTDLTSQMRFHAVATALCRRVAGQVAPTERGGYSANLSEMY
jgi:hypothetical protein